MFHRTPQPQARVQLLQWGEEMNIAGVLVHARSDFSEQVAASLGQIPGLEIHARTKDHRFVITIEEHDQAIISETLLKLYSVEGVLSAAMVYQHCEPEESATS